MANARLTALSAPLRKPISASLASTSARRARSTVVALAPPVTVVSLTSHSSMETLVSTLALKASMEIVTTQSVRLAKIRARHAQRQLPRVSAARCLLLVSQSRASSTTLIASIDVQMAGSLFSQPKKMMVRLSETMCANHALTIVKHALERSISVRLASLASS